MWANILFGVLVVGMVACFAYAAYGYSRETRLFYDELRNGGKRGNRKN